MGHSILKFYFLIISTIFITYSLFASGSHKHQENNHKNNNTSKLSQKVCPITLQSIDSDSFIEFQSQKFYFCCMGCEKKFLKDTKKYFSEMKSRGEVAESTQKKCPVSGDILDKNKVSLTLPGRKFYFCCKKCSSNFKKNKEKYLNKLENNNKKSNHKDKKSHNHHNH